MTKVIKPAMTKTPPISRCPERAKPNPPKYRAKVSAVYILIFISGCTARFKKCYL